LSPNDTYSQHVVTAVVVAHDGAAWLPGVVNALLEQTRPVQRVVAVDTGSRDRSGSVLSGLLGQGVVFGMERSTGYATAVTRALQHRAANVNVPGPASMPGGERVEWVWLLHDDCEPAPDALEQLLRGAAETRAAAVLGPKVKDWADRQIVLETGVTIDTAGRRITGIEPREVDQGQHDGDRDALAVGSAGMLVRRDVWDDVGGFDTGMTLFREDVDFCWRVHQAGYRVRVITDAVVYHVEASARRRRPISIARRPDQLDRRNAMLTLLGNLPAMPMLTAAAGNLGLSLLRALFFLVAKRVAAGLDELAALGSVFGHPFRLLAMRRHRSQGRRAAYGRLRGDLPPGRSLRRIAEFAASSQAKSGQVDTAGSHHATDDPDEADFLLTDTGLAQRILTNPGVLLFFALTVIALVAERSLFGAGPLGGGALVPAWGGASDLWREYLHAFHPVGVGSGDSAPPYLAIVAALATVLGGKPWLAVDVILLGCVPLAGVSAFLAVRRVTRNAVVRVWVAASYALLPVATGAVAAGRVGTAVVFILIPVIALLAGNMLTQPPKRARRAAWATGLTLAAAAAFVPLVWVIAVAAALAFVAVRPALWRNLAIVALVPPVLLLPWSAGLASTPSALLLEVGLQSPGLTTSDLSARSLLLLSPGGPGLPPVWVTAGIAFAALAALLFGRRRPLMMAGWGLAVGGVLIAIAVSRAMIRPANGGPAASAWPGVALLLAAVGLLLAGATAGEALPRLLQGTRTGLSRKARRGGNAAGADDEAGQGGQRALRTLAAVLLAAVAFSAPVWAAASWVIRGVSGPVAPVAAPVVPAVVSAAGSGLQPRTLVLQSGDGHVAYSLQRGDSPSLGDPDLPPVPAAERALNTAVAALVAPNGGEAVDQGQMLAQFDVAFVLLPAPVDQSLARLLDGVGGLRPVSATPAFDLWRLQAPSARVRVVEPNGTVVAVRSGQTGVTGARVPAAGGTLELAEPAGGWKATLNGQPLTQVASPAGGWAQAFRLPAGGGVLTISHNQTSRDLALVLEFLAVAAVAVLALPGSRAAAEASAPAAAGPRAVSSSRAPGGQPGLDAAEAEADADAEAGAEAPVGADATAGGDAYGEGLPDGRRARGRSAARSGRAARGQRRGRDAGSGARRDRRATAARRGGAPAGRRASAAQGLPDGGQAAGPRPRAAGLPLPGSGWQAEEPGEDMALADPGWPADQPGSSLPLPLPLSGWSASQQAEDPAFPGSGWPAGQPGEDPAAPHPAWSGETHGDDEALAGSGWPTGGVPPPQSGWPTDPRGQNPALAGSGWSPGAPGGDPDYPGAGWQAGHQAEGPAGETAAWSAPDPLDARSGWSSPDLPRPRSGWSPDQAADTPQSPSGNWPPPAGSAWAEDEAEGTAGPAGGRRRSPSGTWPPDDPAQPWPAREPDDWPVPEQVSDWPSAPGDMLDPLPPAGRSSRHRRPGPADDEAPGARWPVPDSESGGDAW
jgi:GT2 family glycosyltransferase